VDLVSPAWGEPGKTLSVETKYPWTSLIAQAERLELPTRFLRVIPPDFFTLEFGDLRTFAAEYHPEEHRMVLNRALSFNAAGGVLRPLAKMTHREVATLYHELFHAYMDYIGSRPDLAAVASEEAARLLAFARDQQQCRYQTVTITPLLQKRAVTELRLLSERESWEALNETWAVFVGWAVWAKLELTADKRPQRHRDSDRRAEWAKWLRKADKDGDLIGYYEPEDPAERTVTHKRYLAPAERISPNEVRMLLEILFGEPAQEARQLSSMMSPPHLSPTRGEPQCPE
jgi:hypothetical protein